MGITMMPLPWKYTVTFLLSGMIIGLMISPWTDRKPQDVIISPVPEVYAQNPEPEVLPVQEPEGSDSIEKMFTYFDWEQRDKQQPRSTVFDLIDHLPTVSNTVTPVMIALFGDSMMDTMGTSSPYIVDAMKEYFPNRPAAILNYGIGAQNAKAAALRVSQPYEYKDRSYPTLGSSGAQIIIIESFAYNPLDTTEMSDYQASLRIIIQEAQKSGAKVAFLATIAPIKTNFGKGPGGVNWPSDQAWNHATKIQQFMEAGITVARELNIPIIDVYHKTLQANGEGLPNLVSSHDGIHPSEAGHQVVAKMLIEALIELNWL